MTLEEQVRELAYLKWEQAGYPQGDGVDFWLEAEAAILSDMPCIQCQPKKKVAAKVSPIRRDVLGRFAK